ncbi:MAG: SUMF1/EgtB/PvdO family nonheme iron enzyme [Phormidesmis sp.]
MSKNWAICIGIDNYRFVGKLQYAGRDAREMGKFCQEDLRFDKVFYFAEGAPDVEIGQASGNLIEALPTIGNLGRFLNVQFKQRNFLNPQDNLWFFFAGHGVRREGIDYLLPIDGDPDRVIQTGLPIHEVAERLRRCGAGNIVLMLDACRSGDARDIDFVGIGMEPQQGVVTLFSCTANEKSYEIEALEHGAFTWALLDSLRLPGSECATVDRLSRRLKQRVGELNREHGKASQTPLVRAEPIDKLHLVLLPDKATVHDVAPLRVDAYRAETLGDLDLARQLWIRVLAVIRADLDAIENIERIAVKRAALPQTAQTLDLTGNRTPELDESVREVLAVSTPTFEFAVVTVDSQGNEVQREQRSAEYRREEIAQGVALEMVSIPGGTFLMGSPSGEGFDYEKPQHKVTLQSFWMGRYPVMQAQWKAVAALPKIDQDLNPSPSKFVGDRLPVEQVRWDDAIEFCKRLSKQTGREYRLPSEAEWEYACRAGTTTPFHFGPTMNTSLADYCGQDREISGTTYSGSYGSGPKGEYREQTTNVGSFLVANAFGLYDMHGNVWEWCSDHWHENYAGAPTEGSAWLFNNENAYRLLRGGSWYNDPDDCRSVNRVRIARYLRHRNFGFRAVCASSWTLP